MKPSPKQALVLKLLRESGQATLDEIVAIPEFQLYHNSRKHTGTLLANMVNRGMIERLSPGMFRVVPQTTILATFNL